MADSANNSVSLSQSKKLVDISATIKMPTMFYRGKNDPNWTITFASESCNEVLDCSAHKLTINQVALGKMILLHDTKMVWENVQQALTKKANYQIIYQIKTPHENEKIILDQGKGIFTENNELIELQGFLTDITMLVDRPEFYSLQKYFDLLSAELIYTTEILSGYKSVNIKLSIREIQTLVHLCQGMTMKEIGAKLQVSPRTVEMHIHRIKLKLMCSTKSDLRKLFFMTKTGKKLVSIM